MNRTEELTVVVGAHDLRDMNEGHVRIKVESYHKHLNYKENPYRNDIMLLRVTDCIVQNDS